MVMIGKNNSMKKVILSILSIVAFTFNSFSQEILSNQSIKDMIELGFEEQTIIDKIQTSTSDFDTTIEELKALKQLGASPTILSAMIKSIKKDTLKVEEDQKKTYTPKPKDTEFFWEDGKGNLVKVIFMLNVGIGNTISETELAGYTARIMGEAKLGLKVPSSFIPLNLVVRERQKTDKVLTQNDKTSHIVQLGYSGTNSYGGAVDSVYLIGVNPKIIVLEKTEKELEQEASSQKYRYKKIFIGGNSTKTEGEVSISDEFLSMTYFGTQVPNTPLKDKVQIAENHWKIILKDPMGGEASYEYNGNETKYKSDGGVLIVKSQGYEMIYPLIKSK